MAHTLGLDEIGAGDLGRVGGKAYRCAQLRQAGVPVPDGLVVSADGADSEAALAEIEQSLYRWPQDTLFAVRSSALAEDSAEHSFAGMHDTMLNVPAGGVRDAICACWASVRNPHALAYRQAAEAGESEMPIAVFVQRMVAAVSAGVVFTRNPVDGADEVVLNAARGLGDALVSGTVTPDEWRVRDRAIISCRPAEAKREPVLTSAQVAELSALALRIERLLGAPQDIEWCHDGRQFWIVQARPITTLAPKKIDLEWSRANVREVLPELPSPQILDYVCDVINRSQRLYAGRLLGPEAKFGPVIKAFHGRPYFNVSQFRRMAPLLGQPLAYFLRILGYAGRIAPEDEKLQPRPRKAFLRALPDILRTSSYQLGIGAFVRKHLRRMQRDLEEARQIRVAGLQDRDIWALVQRGRETSVRQLFPVFALAGIAFYEHIARRLLARVPFAYEDLGPPFLAAGEKSVSSQQAFDLLRLAEQARAEDAVRDYFAQAATFADLRQALAGSEFLRNFEDFLARYGHRGHYESDWSLPRYADDPTPLLAVIATHVKAPSCPSPDRILAEQEQAAAEARKNFEAALLPAQRVFLRPLIWWLLRRIKQMCIWRELYRSEMTRLAGEVRRVHLDLTHRFVERGWLETPDDYFFLTFDEVGSLLEGRRDAAAARDIIRRRKEELERWRQIEMPLQLHESDLPYLGTRRPAPAAAGTREFTGLCVSPGRAEAEVVVLRGPGEFARMKPGAIIVAPATDPAWTPLFTLAAGLIVEIGGMLSHASTVAREYGLPALANVPDATRLLKDGDRVRLDATAGRAEVVEAQPQRA
jgi:pyruvate,water dikinase